MVAYLSSVVGYSNYTVGFVVPQCRIQTFWDSEPHGNLHPLWTLRCSHTERWQMGNLQ